IASPSTTSSSESRSFWGAPPSTGRCKLSHHLARRGGRRRVTIGREEEEVEHGSSRDGGVDEAELLQGALRLPAHRAPRSDARALSRAAQGAQVLEPHRARDPSRGAESRAPRPDPRASGGDREPPERSVLPRGRASRAARREATVGAVAPASAAAGG